jgi:hypothetical protein
MLHLSEDAEATQSTTWSKWDDMLTFMYFLYLTIVVFFEGASTSKQYLLVSLIAWTIFSILALLTYHWRENRTRLF